MTGAHRQLIEGALGSNNTHKHKTHKTMKTKSKHQFTVRLSHVVAGMEQYECVEQSVREEGNRILMSDRLFQDNYHELFQSYKAGRIDKPRFQSVFKWQVAAAFRRAHAKLMLA